jgi:ABC-2 type transport system permease protein
MKKPDAALRPVAFLRGARAVFDLTLEGMLWSRRSLLMGFLLGLPAVFALFYRIVAASRAHPPVSGSELYGGFIVALYSVRNALPLVALFYATSLVADEVEGKTITYLFSRPVPRVAILAGKFGAYLATTLSLALPAATVAFFLLATGPGSAGIAAGASDLVRDLGVMALALIAYGAAFTLLGVVLRRPVIAGLLFLLGWEWVANLPGYMPRLTITAYLRSLLRHRPPDEGFLPMTAEALPAPLCVAVLVGVSLASLALAAWIFSKREYVLEQ